ncbi:MAG: PorV/PorQ family protein [Ignavibacteriales bacterium]|nr:PorV/PorQ family protein [Ignavibacteriales bacterium]
MRKYIISIGISCLFFTILTTATFGQQQKLAQTGMKFLSIGSDARASAMGDAVTALEGTSSSMFFNPASMARLTDLVSASVGNTKWIADINHLYGSIAFSPSQGQYGVFGFFFQTVDYGDMVGTIIADNEQGFIETGLFSPSAFAFGVGYAKALSDKFAVGGNVKYVYQDLGSGLIGLAGDGSKTVVNARANTFAFDIGVLYHTGYKSLNFAMSIRNFSKETKFEKENFELPLTFKVGMSFNAMDLIDVNPDMHSLSLNIDAVHPRDFDQQINIGAEYLFMKTIALRAGFSTPNDVHDFTAGFGVQQRISGIWLAADYGYTPFTDGFKDVHRVTVQFAF